MRIVSQGVLTAAAALAVAATVPAAAGERTPGPVAKSPRPAPLTPPAPAFLDSFYYG